MTSKPSNLMSYIIVGLGNPGEEYEQTRHNAGRMAVEAFWKAQDIAGDWVFDKKRYALLTRSLLVSKAAKKKVDVTLVLPETFMNKSGKAVSAFVKSTKAAEKLVVVHDDIDLPLGTVRISFGRGSGGHKGVESIVKSLKTKDFVRVRIGIAPTTPSGKIKKPKGSDKVQNFILGAFKPKELDALKKVFKKTSALLEVVVSDGHVSAMNQFN